MTILFLWIALLFIAFEIYEKLKMKRTITLYDNGMAFDNTYILWRDIKHIKYSGSHRLTLTDYKEKYNKHRIVNLDSAEELGKSIEYIMKTTKK